MKSTINGLDTSLFLTRYLIQSDMENQVFQIQWMHTKEERMYM